MNVDLKAEREAYLARGTKGMKEWVFLVEAELDAAELRIGILERQLTNSKIEIADLRGRTQWTKTKLWWKQFWRDRMLR